MFKQLLKNISFGDTKKKFQAKKKKKKKGQM